MAFDFENFKPSDVRELVDGTVTALFDTASTWVEENKDSLKGYVKASAEAVMQTQADLASGKIKEPEARALMKVHKIWLRMKLRALRYRTHELMNALLDTAMKAVGYAVFNLTGLNIAPRLVMAG